MKKFLKYLPIVIVIGLSACGDDDKPVTDPPDEVPEFDVEIGDSEIPYIIINTNGASVLNEPKIPATMDIYIEKMKVQSNTIGIEYRGSTSFRISDKKSFGIETWDADGNDIDDSFFGFPMEEDWILQGHIVNQGGKLDPGSDSDVSLPGL